MSQAAFDPPSPASCDGVLDRKWPLLPVVGGSALRPPRPAALLLGAAEFLSLIRAEVAAWFGLTFGWRRSRAHAPDRLLPPGAAGRLRFQ